VTSANNGPPALPRRRFLAGTAMAGTAVAGGAAVALGVSASDATAAAPGPGRAVTGTSPELSTFFSTAFVEYYGSQSTSSDGDLWPNCWADDGSIYAANGDGTGFDLSAAEADTVVSRIDGTPAVGVIGVRLAAGAQLGPIWGDPAQYNRKPTGMTCVDGVLYLALQDLKYGTSAFDESPVASISRSDDHGKTWTPTRSPMFPDSRFSTLFFLDFGQDYGLAARALGPQDGAFVYAYGLDWNWRQSYTCVVADPDRLYLGRVPRASVQDRGAWEFFAGLDGDGRPVWTPDIAGKLPVLEDTRRLYPNLRQGGANGPDNLSVISQGGVVYNAPLRRYLYTSWSEYTFEFYEAPAPWGPWRLFLHHDVGCYPWYGEPAGAQADPGPKNGGYGTTIPSKFISPDGLSMWVQSNWQGNGIGTNNYNFCLRRLRVSPARPAGPARRAPATRNLATADGVVPLEKSAHYGRWQYYNDGIRAQSEDSWDGQNKDLDWWGYAWPDRYVLGRVVYTTGQMFGDGGWFSRFDGGLRVQVRRGVTWTDVTGLRISPDYPYDQSAGPHHTYTLTFAPAAGDGIRIIGAPGGASYFTSIGELEVYSG
jgi:Domain of unknown function (DUF4185)